MTVHWRLYAVLAMKARLSDAKIVHQATILRPAAEQAFYMSLSRAGDLRSRSTHLRDARSEDRKSPDIGLSPEPVLTGDRSAVDPGLSMLRDRYEG